MTSNDILIKLQNPIITTDELIVEPGYIRVIKLSKFFEEDNSSYYTSINTSKYYTQSYYIALKTINRIYKWDPSSEDNGTDCICKIISGILYIDANINRKHDCIRYHVLLGLDKYDEIHCLGIDTINMDNRMSALDILSDYYRIGYDLIAFQSACIISKNYTYSDLSNVLEFTSDFKPEDLLKY